MQNKKLTLREIQLVEVNILKKIAQICETYNWKYFLYYGSLLGAVRHGGFIPWDDDIDIVMPRPDYEKLIEYCIENESALYPYKLYHYKTNKNYIYPIARFCDTNYVVNYNNAQDYGLGLFIDIYPLDGCGNTIEEAKRNLRKADRRREPVIVIGKPYFNKISKNTLNFLLWKLIYFVGQYIGITIFLKIIDKKAQKLDYNKSQYVCCLIWPSYSIKEIALKSDYLLSEELQFENIFVKIPNNYDEHLTRLYGDYMKFPPKSEQIPHHDYEAFHK